MEVLLAIGTLAMGMLFIASVFPAAIHLTTVATERTISAAVADEAFAKIQLYDVNFINPALQYTSQAPYQFVKLLQMADEREFAYPSTVGGFADKQYWWVALCRRVDLDNVQVTVFVCRTPVRQGMPVPLKVQVAYDPATGILEIPNLMEISLINDGYTVVDDQTGQIYRVLERYGNNLNLLRLDPPWQGGNSGRLWVTPVPTNGGRYPCIAVYQKIMRF